MKILVITQKIDEADPILGFFSKWIERLAARSATLHAIVLEEGKAHPPENVSIHSLGRERGYNKIRLFLNFNSTLAGVLSKERPDIIFIHMCPMYAILAAPYAKIFNIPLVLWYAHKEVDLKLRAAHFLSDKILTPSKESFRIKSKKAVIVGHGIDVEKFNPLPTEEVKAQNNGKKTILSVGRLSPVKSYEVLIRAADILVNQRNIKDLEFQITGGLPLKSHEKYFNFLKDMVKEYTLEDYFRFIGSVPHTQIQSYYQNCDLFVSTSDTGSLDKAVLEAMASEKPVLTSNEAFKGILNNYLDGQLIFEEGNAAQLSERIDSMLGMEERSRDELGLNLRNIVSQNHNLDKLMDKFIIIFQGLVEDKKGIKK